jgi:hypothetical protein
MTGADGVPSLRNCIVQRGTFVFVQVVAFVVDHQVKNGTFGKSRRRVED